MMLPNHTTILMKYNNCCFSQNKEIINVDNTQIDVFKTKRKKVYIKI